MNERFMYPPFGMWNTEMVFPISYVTKNYTYSIPYVIPIEIVLTSSDAAVTWRYTQPNDSDFMLIKQASALSGAGVLVAIRIPPDFELMSEPIAYDVMFPKSWEKGGTNYNDPFPFYFIFPLIVSRGQTIEYEFTRTADSKSYNIKALLSGVRLY